MYDYIVVGAGAAGCVLAARLSEEPDANVLLLEAGGPDDALEISVPAMCAFLLKTEFDWDFDSEPEPAFDGRRVYIPRGKTLGGTTAINGMIYMRGNRADYDGWAAAGFDGWSFDELLPYFLRSEDNERGESPFHGVGGELTVADLPATYPMLTAWVEACAQLGLPLTDDNNGPVQEGIGIAQRTQRRGMRLSSAEAFLRPAMVRENLTVLTGAQATRVLFDGKRATGVQFVHNGEFSERSAGEVILCGGAYGSPQTLLLSGIGPNADLDFLQIPLIEDLPVGENLQDHCVVQVNHLVKGESLFSAFTPENIEQVRTEGTGPMTSNLVEGCGYIRTRDGLPGPDIWLMAAPGMYLDEGLSLPTGHALTMGASLQGATSRGKVSLRSARPLAKPRIAHNWLTTEADMTSLRAGLRTLLEIAEQSAFADVLTGPNIAPESGSDADLDAFIRRRAQTSYHPGCSCAMGQVVDEQLRVLGVDGLRVADTSVMPELVRGNTMAPTMMIAEKAADMILGRRAPAAVTTG